MDSLIRSLPQPLQDQLVPEFQELTRRMSAGNDQGAREVLFRIVDALLAAHRSGLYDGDVAGRRALEDLLQKSFCITGLPEPAIDLGGEATVEVITPSTPEITITAPDTSVIVEIPGGAVSEPTIITITPVPEPEPLSTGMTQYGPYMEIDASPDNTLQEDIVVGLCIDLPENETADRVRLAHNVAAGFTPVIPGNVAVDGVEILARVSTATLGLQCPPEPANVRAGVMLARRGGIGGRVRKFSPFGAVDPVFAVGAASPVTQVGGAGQPAPQRPAVRVTTTGNAPVAGVSVTFAVSGGAGSVTGGTQLTGADGVATVGAWTLSGVPGENTLVATAVVPGITVEGSPVTFSATGEPGPGNLTVTRAPPDTAYVYTAMAVPPLVRFTDFVGQPVAGATVTVELVPVTQQPVLIDGATAVTDGNGVAAFSALRLGLRQGNTATAQLRFTAPDANPATSATVRVACPLLSLAMEATTAGSLRDWDCRDGAQRPTMEYSGAAASLAPFRITMNAPFQIGGFVRPQGTGYYLGYQVQGAVNWFNVYPQLGTFRLWMVASDSASRGAFTVTTSTDGAGLGTLACNQRTFVTLPRNTPLTFPAEALDANSCIDQVSQYYENVLVDLRAGLTLNASVSGVQFANGTLRVYQDPLNGQPLQLVQSVPITGAPNGTAAIAPIQNAGGLRVLYVYVVSGAGPTSGAYSLTISTTGTPNLMSPLFAAWGGDGRPIEARDALR